mgnify:CR=1 FL=1
MATVIRAEISPKNKYWISKHRYYELKHFCLQYPEWKKVYSEISDEILPLSMIEVIPTNNFPNDPTAQRAIMKAFCLERIKLIEKTALEADPCLYDYIIKGVTEERSYTYLRTATGIPCGKDMYYDRYRKFFWLLNESRERDI